MWVPTAERTARVQSGEGQGPDACSACLRLGPFTAAQPHPPFSVRVGGPAGRAPLGQGKTSVFAALAEWPPTPC